MQVQVNGKTVTLIEVSALPNNTSTSGDPAQRPVWHFRTTLFAPQKKHGGGTGVHAGHDLKKIFYYRLFDRPKQT